MNTHLIANRRPGRKATMIHIAGIGCPALAQATHTRPLGDAWELSEVLRNALALANTFKQVSICRKCRSAARQRIAIAAKLAEKVSAPEPEVTTVPLVVEMGDSVFYGAIHRKGCRSVEDPMNIGDASDLSEVPDLLMDATGWDDYTVEELTFCPCAKTWLT